MGDEFGVSHRSEIARMRRLAISALDAWELRDPRVQLIAHRENTTFGVTAADGGQYLLRVHRPNRHGRHVDSAAAVRSELEWLDALRTHTSLAVPQPVRTVGGDLTVRGERVCSLLGWMKGRNYSKSARPVHLHRLGGVLAQLHDHADRWAPPEGFVRIRWDQETFFGNTLVYGDVDAADAWNLLPADLRRVFDRAAAQVADVMGQLGQTSEVFGLIHADAHLDNVLFDGQSARLIDFDDCGFGYRIYDVAVALWEFRHREDYPAFRAAFVDGYTRCRPLPDDQLRHVDAFIAAREVAFGLWYVGMAESHAAFRDDLAKELEHVERGLRMVLDRGRR